MVQSEKKVSISSADPTTIRSGIPPVSEPSGLLYLAVVISLLGAVGLGLVIGYLSPVQKKLFSPTQLEESSWAGALVPLGALFGGLLAPVLTRFLGKKKALISHGLPFSVGWICIILNSEPENHLFFIGRFITGVCCGLVCGAAPGYVSEISTINKRGLLGSCFQLFITIGILITSCIGFLEYKTLAIICAIPSAMMSVLMIFMPESPIQIISKGPINDKTINLARKELIRLRSQNSTIDLELNVIIETQKILNETANERISEKITKSDFYKPLTYSLFLMLIQQMSGINAILFYSEDIFRKASQNINLTLATIALTLVQSLTTLVEIFVVEKLGRRLLLVLSGCGCSLGLGVMGFYFFMKDQDTTFEINYSWLPIAALLTFIISFSMGLAPVPWLMVPELTPANNRAVISGVATAFNWSIAFLVTKFFSTLAVSLGAHNVYFIFMAHTIVGVALLLVFLPETGGRDLEEIFRRYNSGWKNSLFLATVSKKDIISLETHQLNSATLNDQSNSSV